MSEYNQYITAVNKIFDYLSKMKVGWPELDNLNYIASIEEYKQKVVDNLKLFKNPQQPEQKGNQENKESMEEVSEQ